MTWKIFYDDDSIASEADGPPPARGVQVIVQDHPDVGVELVTGADYYVRDGNRWRGVDIFGLFDYLMDSGIVLFGRTISKDEYSDVIRRANAAKAGWLPFERKP